MPKNHIPGPKNFRESNSKNNPKKSASKNSNRDKVFCLLWEELDSLYGLDLIKPNFKKMVFSEYEKKVLEYDFSKIKKDSIIRMRIRDILDPLITLDKSFCRKHDGDKLKDMLDLMFGLPFSVLKICEEFDEHDTDKKKSMDRYIRRLAKQIEKSGIFQSGWIYDEEYGIERSTKLDNAQFWWIPLHNDTQDLWEHVLNYYKMIADKRGKKLTDKGTDYREKAEKKVIQKAHDTVAKSQFVQTPLGKTIVELEHTGKSTDFLKQKAKTLNVMREGVTTGNVDTSLLEQLEETQSLFEGPGPEKKLLLKPGGDDQMSDNKAVICVSCGIDITKHKPFNPYTFQKKKYCAGCIRSKKHLLDSKIDYVG